MKCLYFPLPLWPSVAISVQSFITYPSSATKFHSFSPILAFPIFQRWTLTLANMSNARHRSNIRVLPPPPGPPDVCIQSVGICVARRGRKRFIANWGQDVTYLSLHTIPPPSVYRSKVESRHFAHLCYFPSCPIQLITD